MNNGTGAIRLQKILSAHGIASRRAAEEMIAAGRVSVNGIPAKPGQRAIPDTDIIEVDGKALAGKEERVYIALNKPCGYLTTVKDDRGRKTVMELVRGAGADIYPAGRLDMNTEGLLILTNDGQFANALIHPSNGKKKVYHAVISEMTDNTIPLLQKPMLIDGRTVKVSNLRVLSVQTTGCELEITLTEGRNRQIRKMCAAAGARVKSLRRISVGNIKLGSLKTGQWRYLTDDEIKGVYSEVCNREV